MVSLKSIEPQFWGSFIRFFAFEVAWSGRLLILNINIFLVDFIGHELPWLQGRLSDVVHGLHRRHLPEDKRALGEQYGEGGALKSSLPLARL